MLPACPEQTEQNAADIYLVICIPMQMSIESRKVVRSLVLK